jgi:hypothetical protein
MSTTTEQIVRQLGEFFALKKWDAVRQCLTENVTFHIPGKNSMSGTYRGIDEALALLTRWAGRLDAVPMSSNLLQTSSGEQRVIMIMQRTALVDGVQHQWIEKVAFFFNGEQIAACWLFADNTAAFDSYWSSPRSHSPSNQRTRLTGGGAAPFSVIA